MKNRTNLVELVLFLVAPHTWRILNILEDEMVERENPDIPDTIAYLYDVQANTPKKVDQFVKQQLKTNNYQLIWLCDSRTNTAEYTDSNDTDHIYSVN